MKDSSTLTEHTPRPGSVSHYAFAFTPPGHRPASLALYALNRALDTARDSSDPGVARLKLQWWRDELQRLHNGQPRHPITQALDESGVAIQATLEGLVISRESELSHRGIVSWDDFQELSLLGAGQSLELWSRLLGHPVDRITHQPLRNLAIGLQLCSALFRCHGAALRGHSTLPLEWLEQGNGSSEQLSRAQPDDSTQRLLAGTAERGIAHLQQAMDEWPDTEKSVHLPLLIAADLRRHILSLQKEEGFSRLDQRVTTTPLRKLWRAWRLRRRLR